MTYPIPRMKVGVFILDEDADDELELKISSVNVDGDTMRVNLEKQEQWLEYKVDGVTTTSLEEAVEMADGAAIVFRKIIASKWFCCVKTKEYE